MAKLKVETTYETTHEIDVADDYKLPTVNGPGLIVFSGSDGKQLMVHTNAIKYARVNP